MLHTVVQYSPSLWRPLSATKQSRQHVPHRNSGPTEQEAIPCVEQKIPLKEI